MKVTSRLASSWGKQSKVILGYICNETRRFYVYVSNHVLHIRNFFHPEQWRHVSTDQNPADLGTRSVPASHLKRSSCLHGPRFISSENEICQRAIDYSLVELKFSYKCLPLRHFPQESNLDLYVSRSSPPGHP